MQNGTITPGAAQLKKQKKEKGEAVISTVLFDDYTEVLHNRKKIKNVKPITEDEYYVRGCTALLDAVGGAIRHIDRVHKEMPAELVAPKVVVPAAVAPAVRVIRLRAISMPVKAAWALSAPLKALL